MRQLHIVLSSFLLFSFLLISSSEAVIGKNANCKIVSNDLAYDRGKTRVASDEEDPVRADNSLNKAEAARIIIHKVINAYGGKKAIENITSLYARGLINAISFSNKGSYEYYFKRGGKLKVDIEYSRSSERRILDGRKGYESINMAPFSEVAAEGYLGMEYQYKQLDMPYELLKDVPHIRYEGQIDLAGVETAVFDLNDHDGPPMKLYIDMRNFHIVKVSGSFSMGDNKMFLSSEYSDFRKIHGNTLPFKISNYAGSQLIAETVIIEYRD